MNNTIVKMEQNPANQANNNSNSSSNNNSNNSVNSNANSNNNNTNNRCNLIVNYLPQSIKEQDFNQLFGKIGPVKACKLMFDRQTGYSFGYGFVEYLNEDDARKAIEAFNGYQIQHKRLKVAYARPNCEDTKNTNLYIRNIPISYDEQQIEDLFSQYGEVIQVRLLRDQNTAFSRRIGFVIMATKQMAQNAIKNLDNTVPPNGGTEPIYVKYADEEGKKRHGPGGGNSFGNMNHGMNTNQRNQNHHHHHHQNPYQNTSNYLNQHNAAHGFNFGKMKSNRTSGHQNRYNPIGGGNAGLNNPVGMNNTGMSQANNGAGGANGYNPWNMAAAAAAAAALQQPYSNYGAPNTLIGNSGFDNLINTIGSGGASSGNANNSNYGSHHPNMHHHQGHHMQQQHLHNSSNSSSAKCW